jgi:hypothetical protein
VVATAPPAIYTPPAFHYRCTAEVLEWRTLWVNGHRITIRQWEPVPGTWIDGRCVPGIRLDSGPVHDQGYDTTYGGDNRGGDNRGGDNRGH